MALSLYYLSSFSFSGFDPLGGISVLKDKDLSSPLGLPTQNQEPCPKETVIASSKIQPASHFSKMEQQRDMAERTILPASTGGSQGSTIINTVPKQVAAKVFSFSNCSDDITPRVVLPSLDHTIISSSMQPAEWEEMRLPQENEIFDLLESVYGASCIPS